MKFEEEDCFDCDHSHKVESDECDVSFEASIMQIINSLEDEPSTELNLDGKPEFGLCLQFSDLKQDCKTSSIKKLKEEIFEDFITKINSKKKVNSAVSLWSEIDINLLASFTMKCSVKIVKFPVYASQMYESFLLKDLKRLSNKRKHDGKAFTPAKQSKLNESTEATLTRKTISFSVEKTQESKRKKKKKSTTLIKPSMEINNLKDNSCAEKDVQINSKTEKLLPKSKKKRVKNKSSNIVCETFIPSLKLGSRSKRNDYESSYCRGYIIMNDTSVKLKSILSNPKKLKKVKKKVSFCTSIFIRRFEPDDDESLLL